jgi:hypothetical protein
MLQINGCSGCNNALINGCLGCNIADQEQLINGINLNNLYNTLNKKIVPCSSQLCIYFLE